MEEITYITTAEAVTLLGCSERTLRRRLRKADIQPVMTGQAPGEQHRYDRHDIESLARSNGQPPPTTTVIDTPDTVVEQIMAAIDQTRQAQQKSTTAMTGQLTAIDERLARLEVLLERRDEVVEAKPGFWKRLFGG